jgi:hypothetical protein
MMGPAVMVIVAMTAIGAAFRLEWSLHGRELRAEAMEHFLNHVIGSNAKKLISDFSRQMPISQVPR